MTDSYPEPTEAEMAEINRLLGDPAVWAEPSVDVEDRVLAAIVDAGAENRNPGRGPVEASNQRPVAFEHGAAANQAPQLPAESAEVVDLSQRRERRDRRLWPLSAAAAVLIAAAVSATVFLNRPEADDPNLITVAMAPSEAAPDAEAVARIVDRPNGAQIVIEIDGLEPAPEGSYYEVWLVRPEPQNRVTAGTFHMRGADQSEIEFWAGVSPEIYNVVTITLESEEDPDVPSQPIFRGDIVP